MDLRALSILGSAAALAVIVTPRDAYADWQATNFDVIAQGAPYTVMEPSLATGVVYPSGCEEPPCRYVEPIPVTRIAFVNGGLIYLAWRIGGPGQPWSEPSLLAVGAHPTLVLDRHGAELVTFMVELYPGTGLVAMSNRAPAEGSLDGVDWDFRSVVVEPETIDMPAPPVIQYPGWDLTTSATPRRIHVVYSVRGELWHAHIAGADFENGGVDFASFPIGDDVWYEGPEGYEPDDVAGTWPAAAPLWTDDQTSEGPLDYEPMPVVSFNRSGVDVRRMEESNSAQKYWTEIMDVGQSYDQRSTIDAVRDGPPHVAWAPPCTNGGAELYYRRSAVDDPWHIQEWESLEATGSENACDPSLSIGYGDLPFIAYVDPSAGTVRVTVRTGDGWDHDDVGDGSEPSMDYNPLTEVQTIAYVEPSSGELRVVDGYWD